MAYRGLCTGTRVGASSSLTHPSVGGGKRQPFRERGRERRGTFKLARRPARHGPARCRRARAASGPRGAGAAGELAGHQQPPPPQPAARPGPPLAAPHRAAPLAARGRRPEAFAAAAPGGPAVGSAVGGSPPARGRPRPGEAHTKGGGGGRAAHLRREEASPAAGPRPARCARAPRWRGGGSREGGREGGKGSAGGSRAEAAERSGPGRGGRGGGGGGGAGAAGAAPCRAAPETAAPPAPGSGGPRAP